VNVIGIQFDIAWENKPENFSRVRAFIAKANAPKESLVVLPEMFATGFSMNAEAIAEPYCGETEQFLADTAREFGVYLIGGAAMKARDGRARNKALVFSPGGELIGFYAKDAGQTTWKTLRRQPWHITGVSHATRPPAVLVDGLELTVVTGSPSSGEAQVLDEGGAIGTITTDTDDTDGAEWLELRYHPVFLVAVANVSRTLQDVNFWQVDADFAEHLEGVYTAPTGS
jgi:hypothetical protein